MDRLFEDSFIPRAINNFAGRSVAANLFETPEGFILTLNLPKAEHVKARTLKITTKR